MTEAVPPNLACLLSGVIGHEEPGLLICSASTDWALIRTPAEESWYSRFPDGAQHLATKPNVAFAFGSVTLAALRVIAGSDSRSPVGEKMGSSPGIWPPPVTLPAV